MPWTILPSPAYTPFWNPLPAWDYWYVLLVPLCIGISIIYKAIKCHEPRQVPREAAMIFLFILLGMGLSAVILVAIMKWLA